MAGGDQLERLWASLMGLGPRRLAALAGAGLAIFAIVGFSSYYISRPDMEVLYAGLAPADVARMGSVLRESGVSFDVNAEATKVFVKRGEAARARMLLAERGLPNGATAGYELFDKLGSMGLTSFMQNITRLRALEGEIARTIQVMKGVKAARVHLVLPDPGSFRREPQAPSASVVIRTDSPELTSAAAIRQLVSAAVPGMVPEHVAVLSTEGIILAAGSEVSGAASGRMLDLEKQVSRNIAENIRRTLVPFLGLGNFETSVSARLNLDKRQINETAFDPDSKVERSTRTIKESGSTQNSATKWNVSVEQNIPGEASGAKPSSEGRRASERKEEITNFEVNSKTITTVSDGYRVEKIAVAVVVNRKRLLPPTSDTTASVEEQIKSVERLAASAAGLYPERGDKITVAAVDFASASDLEPLPPPSVWEQFAGQAGNYVLATAILLSATLFVSVGLRPALRLLLENRKPGPEFLTGPQFASEAKPAFPANEDERGLELQKLEAPPALPSGLKKPSPLKQVEKAIADNEEQAAEILKEWIRES